MTKKSPQTAVCQICKKRKALNEILPGALVHDPIVEIIIKKYPAWSPDGFICLEDLNHFRAEYVRAILEEEKGELSTLEEQVMKSLRKEKLLAKNINVEFEEQLTRGERLADRFAAFGGSWRFIGIFAAVLLVWIVMNTAVLIWKPFDPYPYILLNLVLSCIAAMQAPIIMMSQNRQEDKDRLRSQHDYLINLKAELEIRQLHEKIDHLLKHQWQRLLEIQATQTDLMEGLALKTPRERDA
ncbi:MAG: DUF1003 domain-containing protein [Desulfobacterales bacterium]|nr:DUF1003 domain-containing protein [Desulfobacterales bacterium]